MRFARYSAGIAAIAAAILVSSCSKDTTTGPSGPPPHYSVSISLVSKTTVSTVIRILGDSTATSAPNDYLLLRGAAGSAPTDTVFNGALPLSANSVTDSARGAWLRPGTAYTYRCYRLRDGKPYDTSNALDVALDPALTLALATASPISIRLLVTSDSAASAISNTYIIVRGASAGALTDTVFAGTIASGTLVLDSNRGKWLAPSTPYLYQCIRTKAGASLDASSVVQATTAAGDLVPLRAGSVWVYSGYITDTLTGGKKAGSEYTTTDSLVGPTTIAGYNDVYQMVSRIVPVSGAVRHDTLTVRMVNGDLWLFGALGLQPRPTWQNIYRFATGSGQYLISQRLDTITGPPKVFVRSQIFGRVDPPVLTAVPAGSWTASPGQVRYQAAATIPPGIPVFSDTINANSNFFAKGIGSIKRLTPSYLAASGGLVSPPKQEGSFEELVWFRVNY